MLFRKTTVIITIFLTGWALSSLAAFSPTLIAGSSAEQIYYSATDSSQRYRFYGIGSWRTTLTENGYAAVEGNAELSYSPEMDSVLSDSEKLSATIGFSGAAGTTVLDIAFLSSIDDADFGTTANPEWSAEYRFSSRSGSFAVEPYVGYSGEYLYQELGTTDKSVHTASLGIAHNPSIMRGYRLELTGSGTFWNEKYLYDPVGSESDTLRRDYETAVEAEVNGLAGYFADWSLIIDGGVLLSNGNSLTGLGTVQNDSFDAWFNGVEAEWSWSPARSVQFSAHLYSETRSYLQRKVLNEDGSIGSDLLSTVNIGGNVTADWTPDDRMYFILSLFGRRTFSNDVNFEAWNMGISGSVEYGF